MKKSFLALLVGSALFTQPILAADTPAANQTVSYLTSWGLTDGDAAVIQNSKIDTFLLAFAKWDANGVIETSDGIATVPDYDPWWMPTSYITWTQAKHANPKKKMMLAFGGQSYEDMWSHIDTPEKREKVAQNLVKLLDIPFPVYKKNLKPYEKIGECLNYNWNHTVCDMTTYQQAGIVFLDGIDFDFEKGARLTEKESDDLLKLVTRIRELTAHEKVEYYKLSLTTYHVGADPKECSDNTVFEGCSFTESKRSEHNGEVTELLKKGKNLFDSFNVMTYDAGPNFKYQTAMANYAKAVGDASKVLLGNTINSQWGPDANFVETWRNNISRSEWQAQKGYGGLFVWTVGANSEQKSVAEQVTYIEQMREAAQRAAEGGAIISSLSVTPGTVMVNIPDAVFKSENRIIVKKNGNYLGEIYAGKSYYSAKTTNAAEAAAGDVAISFTTDLKARDVITVDLHKGQPGNTIVMNTLRNLAKLTVTEKMIKVPDVNLNSVKVTAEGVTVTLPESVYKGKNRIIIRKNDTYIGESYNGVHYYSYNVNTTAGQKAFMMKTPVKSGDKIEVSLVSGAPGTSYGNQLKQLYLKKAAF